MLESRLKNIWYKLTQDFPKLSMFRMPAWVSLEDKYLTMSSSLVCFHICRDEMSSQFPSGTIFPTWTLRYFLGSFDKQIRSLQPSWEVGCCEVGAGCEVYFKISWLIPMSSKGWMRLGRRSPRNLNPIKKKKIFKLFAWIRRKNKVDTVTVHKFWNYTERKIEVSCHFLSLDWRVRSHVDRILVSTEGKFSVLSLSSPPYNSYAEVLTFSLPKCEVVSWQLWLLKVFKMRRTEVSIKGRIWMQGWVHRKNNL